MVLQRDRPIPVWGSADPGETVTVSLNGAQQTVRADRKGAWRVVLPALPAGGPYTLTVAGRSTLTLSDVLIGDVWICGGQSNMQWQISQTGYVEADTAFIRKNRIRFFSSSVIMDYVPREAVVGGGWKSLTQETLQAFSAVGYHFGKYLQDSLDVPIGLISANLGATSVETWMSNEALMDFPQFKSVMEPVVRDGRSFEQLEASFEKTRDKWYAKHYYNGVGIREAWFSPETSDEGWKPIEVAGNTWEEEPELKDHDGAVWFRTTFDLPEGFDAKEYLLQLGQIDDYDITWVNGEKIGETYGRHNHRNYSIPASRLRKKGNVLVVRVYDIGGIGGFTTNVFWAVGPLLHNQWEYRKGELLPRGFVGPRLPNATPFSSPGVLFNGMIAPLTRVPIRGAIWYQGESNASRAWEYRMLFPAMIRDWRKHWGYDFPFLFVQLANYMAEPSQPGDSDWAELREAQAMALKLPVTGMATAIDIGEAGDIHPRNKKDVGIRLGRAALKVAYGRNVVASGPAFDRMEVEGDVVRISFTHIGSGLKTLDKYGCIRGLEVAGADRKFYWARAFISGDQVVVHSPEVTLPVAVRYAWADNPGPLDLYNEEGLPALPFRTDDWPCATEGETFSDGPRF